MVVSSEGRDKEKKKYWAKKRKIYGKEKNHAKKEYMRKEREGGEDEKEKVPIHPLIKK